MVHKILGNISKNLEKIKKKDMENYKYYESRLWTINADMEDELKG
jgi:hypothetical protein